VRVTGYAEVVPDLVVEVVSPNDTAREANDKARMWLGHGVRLVWVIHPDTRAVAIHRQDGLENWLDDTDTLDREDVLPGFTCDAADIFD
jgi:Uma2 family endonuclease